MNKAFSKLVCSAVAVVAMGAQAFAQTTPMTTKQDKCATASMFQQGDDGLGMQVPAAYNMAAGISTKGWDMFFDASFIYWHASQDQMDLARSAGLNGAGALPVATASDSSVLYQDTSYNPGFKAGFGFNSGYDGWIGSLEYTWLHQTTTTKSDAPASVILNSGAASAGVWKPSSWFDYENFAVAQPHLQFSHIHSTWKLQMDLIDMNMSRPFYQGRQLTVLPYAGLRSMFLRQALRIHGTNALNTAMPKLTSENISQSWSIGPNAGMNAHWIVGAGFRFEGFAGASILYTRYTKIAHDEHDQAILTTTEGPTVGRVTQLGALRPVADAGVGFGWGGYFSDQDFHFDLLARYDFMVAWNQNVMRQLVNTYFDPAISPAAGDLYFHGATATLRFDF